MWALHWLDALDKPAVVTPGVPTVTPPTITGVLRTYRYLGPPTFLALPASGIKFFKFIGPQQVLELPVDWPWTIRALETGVIESVN